MSKNSLVQKKKKKDYQYRTWPIIKEFNDKDGKLSVGMEKIRQIINDTAVDDLNEKKFREFYEEKSGFKFFGADFTEILDPSKKDKEDQTAGFLFAIFYENKMRKGPKYVAKAFHAVKKQYRQTEEYKYERSQLHKKYILFFLKHILTLELLNAGKALRQPWLKNNTLPTIKEIKTILLAAKKRVTSKTHLQVEIFAENPTTYSDIRNYNLRHQTVRDLPAKYAWLKTLSGSELMYESCKIYKKYDKDVKKVKRPRFLEPTSFTVNTSHLEWVQFFENPYINDYQRFYLWQNFGCPRWAFKMIIPVDPENILNAVFATLEIKGYIAVRSFLERNVFLQAASKLFLGQNFNKENFKIPSNIKNAIKRILLD